MGNIIACNLGSYRGQFSTQEMYAHLAKIGLTNVEVGTPEPDQIEATLKELADYGLTTTTTMARHDVKDEGFVSDFQTTLETVQSMGGERIFLSAHAGEIDKEIIYSRLQDLGKNAQDLGLTVCLETHPDLANNGDVALETMQAVNHPGIAINFDTANVHYHTDRDIDTVEEIQKILNHVKAVHLKDTTGGYHTWNFPTLGEGIVDFKAVFNLLSGVGFIGPYTMELEGIEGENLDSDGVLKRVEESFQYLIDIGVAD